MSLTFAPPIADPVVTLSTTWDPTTDPHVQVVAANTRQRLTVIHELLEMCCRQHGELLIPAPTWMAPGMHVDEVERTLQSAMEILEARLTAPETPLPMLTVFVDERHAIASEARNEQQLHRINDAIRRLMSDGHRAGMHVIVGDVDVDPTLTGLACTVAVGPVNGSEREALEAAFPGVHVPAVEDGEGWFFGTSSPAVRIKIWGGQRVS